MSTPPLRVVEGDDARSPAQLILSGRVTVAESNDFHRLALELVDRRVDVTVDCDAVEYLDTAAVQILLALGLELKRSGSSLAMTGMSVGLQEDFRLMGFADGTRSSA